MKFNLYIPLKDSVISNTNIIWYRIESCSNFNYFIVIFIQFESNSFGLSSS